MTEVAKRIEKLRALMAEQNIDAYVVSMQESISKQESSSLDSVVPTEQL